MREATTILDFQNVTRTSGNVTAIHDISFQIREGEIFGLIGPNGAGKSTIIKTIVGHLKPDSGEIEINHYNLFSEFQDAIDFVGAVVEYPSHYDNMSGWANLKLAAAMYPEVSKERLKEVVELVGMENCIQQKVRKYTLEMRQRLALAQAILNYPHLLILDEPMNGLDPVGIRDLCKLLKSLARSGMSILIASHLMDETEDLCDRVGILSHGYLLAQQDLHEYHDLQAKSLLLRVSDAVKAEKVLKTLFDQRVDIQIVENTEEQNILSEDTEEEETVLVEDDSDLTLSDAAEESISEETHDPEELQETSKAEESQVSGSSEKTEALQDMETESSDPCLKDEMILTVVDLPAWKINRALIENGIEVDQISVRKQSLEELFLKLTGGAVIE